MTNANESRQALAPYARYCTRPFGAVVGDLEHYAALLTKWQVVQNLVSRETLGELWTRHFADSLQVLKRLSPDDRRFLDLGSGGGLPALPLAIARVGQPGVSFRLVEPNARKASFLRTVARELSLPVCVENRRAEDIDSRETPAPDVVTSRALAPLPRLLPLAAPHFGTMTRGIFHKGRDFGEEVSVSRASWSFDMLVITSDTSDGALLEISNIRATSMT